MEATIRFSDGTEITAEKNGDCFITAEKPDFPEDLSEITVETEEGTRTYENTQATECASADGRYWFSFTEEDQTQKAIRELREDTEDALNGLLEFVLGEE